MKQDIFLWLILGLYFHLIRFLELREHTTMKSFKEYRKLNGGIFYIILFTQIMILAGYWLLKYCGV